MSQASSIELKLPVNALTVLERRYLAKNADGKATETPHELFQRVADNIASAETRYDPQADTESISQTFYKLMTDLEFLPNSPTLMNAGRDLQQLSACFVLPIEDSMESIFETVKNAALIHKSGGGTGFSFSRIRPQNARVRSTSGCASGPVSFMKVFNASTEAVKQGGTRRGANMAILRVDHPDILQFIHCKQDTQELTNFNISVALTDAFMQALEKDGHFDLVNPKTQEVTGQLNAREVFDQVVHNAWQTGEPGIVFIDRINAHNPTPQLGEIESTNPCGEQPLLPYEACNLGSINLAVMITETDGMKVVDYARLKRVVRTAVHFLDNVIDVSAFPLEKIDQLVKTNRKIGLGVMGFADMLLKLGVPYNTERALQLAENIMNFIQEESRQMSRELAQTRGAFPAFPESRYAKNGERPLRNATTTTIAPTGTISILAGVSSGIEPLFAVSFVRNVMDNDKLIEVNPVFKQTAVFHGFDSPDLMQRIAEKGTVQDIDGVPDDIRKIFVTAHDITPLWHTRMQAAFQKHTDNAVSKTVNFPKKATQADVREVFLKAYESGCKGVTIYRDGSREGQVLSVSGSQSEAEDLHKLEPRKRPDVIQGCTYKMRTGCGNLYITLNHDETGLFEIFTQMGKSGGCAASQSEAISRLVSMALRADVNPEAIIKNLRGIRCPNPAWAQGGMILSCPDAIGLAIEQYLKWRQGDEKTEKLSSTMDRLDQLSGACPECGGAIEHEGGCMVCRSCGFSRCS